MDITDDHSTSNIENKTFEFNFQSFTNANTPSLSSRTTWPSQPSVLHRNHACLSQQDNIAKNIRSATKTSHHRLHIVAQFLWKRTACLESILNNEWRFLWWWSTCRRRNHWCLACCDGYDLTNYELGLEKQVGLLCPCAVWPIPTRAYRKWPWHLWQTMSAANKIAYCGWQCQKHQSRREWRPTLENKLKYKTIENLKINSIRIWSQIYDSLLTLNHSINKTIHHAEITDFLLWLGPRNVQSASSTRHRICQRRPGWVHIDEWNRRNDSWWTPA